MLGLNPGEEEMAQARRILLQQLNDRTPPDLASDLALTIEMLDPAHEDLTRSRQILFTLLDKQTFHYNAECLIRALMKLNPMADELAGAPFWSFRSDPRLLAAARTNSRLTEWLALLPALSLRHS